MKSLSQYVLESLRINECIIDEENIMYKIDSWFENSRNEKFKEFFEALCTICRDKKYVDDKLITEFIEAGNQAEIYTFVDYICDNIKRQCDEEEFLDYKNTFKKIVQLAAPMLVTI